MASLTILVSNAGLHFGERQLLPWSATNLPPGSFVFRQREPIYWTVEMASYDADRGRLTLLVTDFEAALEDYQPERAARRPVRSVCFLPLDRAAFQAQLTYYAAPLLPYTTVGEEKDRPIGESTAELSESTAPASPPPATATKESGRPLSFRVSWAEVTIETGYLSGQYAPGPFDALPFRIPNPYLLSQFNTIRDYFRRALRRSTIDVTAELHFPDGEPALRHARSPQVERIDDRMLQLFRSRALQQLTRPAPEIDRGLFTPDAFLASLDDDDPGRHLLPPAGQDLLEALLGERSVRNAPQLRYLAGQRQAPGQPLRYVLNPKFGFVFLVIGEEMHHFILELLDSNATYVWSLPREAAPLAEHYRMVEQEIRRLSELGRAAYRRVGTLGPAFRLVAHDHATSALIDGFAVWRNKLEDGLW